MGVGAGLYMCDVVVKSSRSLSHLLMSSCLHMLITVAADWFSSDISCAIRYVLPVLWMTLCSHTTRHMASDVGSINVGGTLYQVVRIYNVFTRGRHPV